MTVRIDKTPNGTVVTASGVSTKPQRVEIVPGSVREGKLDWGTNSSVSGVVLTVRSV